jgi:hypothetical protein
VLFDILEHSVSTSDPVVLPCSLHFIRLVERMLAGGRY